jgi:RNA polymerase sigma-70 factor (ECF subfamily)
MVNDGVSDVAAVARVLGGDGEVRDFIHGAPYRRAASFPNARASRCGGGRVAGKFRPGPRHFALCRDPAAARWLYRITARCRSHLSRRGYNDIPLSEAPPLADPSDAWAVVERAEQVALVERALASLSAEKREAFVLKHVEGMSYEEMAAVTGARIPTLKMRVHRAREALLAALEELV